LPGYRRTTSRVLVRKVTAASRASLDYAAYHANFMNADPPPEGGAAVTGGEPRVDRPFANKIVADSLTGSLGSTPLTAAERAHAVALTPLVELMVSKHIAGADRLEDVISAVRAETWQLPGGPQIVRQTATIGYLHDPGAGRSPEIWLQIEFAPWFHGFSALPDDDGDGAPNVYGRVDSTALGDPSALVTFIRTEYEGHALSPGEVKSWAHQLASYWYPSYNTDLVPTPKGWPTEETEAEVRKELGTQTFPPSTIVMRGKPQGTPVYNVFFVPDAVASATAAEGSGSPAPLVLRKSVATPLTKPIKQSIAAELRLHGGSWSAWTREVAPLTSALKSKLSSIPSGAKAFSGADGFMFFGRSVAYAVGGDLARQSGDRNPLPKIAEFRKFLARHGVDLLFVPVPTKVEVYPDKVASGDFTRFAGSVVNPFERKFLGDLAAEGVESVDLLPAFLAARQESAKKEAAQKGEGGRGSADLLYQAQDTHWTSQGLELAAHLIAARIRRYPWYKDLAAHRRTFQTKEASFTRYGDLHSRLAEADRSRYQPETLSGHQILSADGALYEDDPDSPIVVLGDSFTAAYELIDCEHAGVSAHLAKEIGYPVDLVMSYGGGPNVRQKLLRRGEAALGSKKLVIWMMTARDLYDFKEGWAPLPRKP